MARLGSWITPCREGIYVKPADAWIDPSQPKATALVTHGHADHARDGHGKVFATPETLAIMDCRYGPQPGTGIAYGETIRLGDVDIRFVPAGHVLGSAQIVLEHAGERIVVSGDYKRRPDPTCAPFEPVPCDIFITEATFGLPVFRHPATSGEIDRLLQRLCALYEEWGVPLGELRPATGVPKDDLRGHIVIAPPGQLNDRWSRRLPEPITAMASGWMRVRQRARQQLVEMPLIVSDHADWDELTTTIRELAPREVWITHGREEALKHWCMTRQIKARELNLVGYEDEDD